ncbi:MAG: glycosyltransferase [Spirosomataceae bacterium]
MESIQPTKKRVLLLSTVHASTDPRIAGKIAISLSEYYEVACALTVGEDNAWQALVEHQKTMTDCSCIATFPFFRRLWHRVLVVHPQVLWCFFKYKPHIVHIFVAELLPLVFIFQWFGAEIIYEVQENLYKKIPTKTHNKGTLYQWLFRYFDQKARKKFKFIFTEESYLNFYPYLKKPYRVIQNFAAVHWLFLPRPVPDLKMPTFFYTGVISNERAFDTLLKALNVVKEKYPNVRLRLFGYLRIPSATLSTSIDYQQVKDNLIFHGYFPQEIAFAYTKDALAGIALLKPVGDYAESYPTKLFDYMALGLPVITSNLPLLKAVVEPNACGFCISPYDAEALAACMIWCIEHPEELKTMGKNARKAIKDTYNWKTEESKLLEIYAA